MLWLVDMNLQRPGCWYILYCEGKHDRKSLTSSILRSFQPLSHGLPRRMEPSRWAEPRGIHFLPKQTGQTRRWSGDFNALHRIDLHDYTSEREEREQVRREKQVSSITER